VSAISPLAQPVHQDATPKTEAQAGFGLSIAWLIFRFFPEQVIPQPVQVYFAAGRMRRGNKRRTLHRGFFKGMVVSSCHIG
jgi:hypothetical protein